MILNCDNCSARLTLDDPELPTHPFAVRCSECVGTINVSAFAADNLAGGFAGGEHAAHKPGYAAGDHQPAAPVAAKISSSDEVLRLLAQALRGLAVADSVGTIACHTSITGAARCNAKRALVCLQREMCATIAGVFAAKGYEVFAADDSDDAVKRLREDRAEVLVLATEFDAPNQGALFVTRELSALRMPERRRIFVVQISRTARTADAHAAFLASVNLVVNEADLDRLDAAFDRAERAHQELYFDGKMNTWRKGIEDR